jgi:hypothetical protein
MDADLAGELGHITDALGGDLREGSGSAEQGGREEAKSQHAA